MTIWLIGCPVLALVMGLYHIMVPGDCDNMKAVEYSEYPVRAVSMPGRSSEGNIAGLR